MKHILYCKHCKKYTMQEQCSCGAQAETTRPAKYAPDDKYGPYRRKARKAELQKRGLV